MAAVACLKAISCGCRTYDTLEAKRRIAEQVTKISATNRVRRPRPMKATTLAWYSNEGGRNICIGVFLARRSLIKELR